jgi:hypothetical protein
MTYDVFSSKRAHGGFGAYHKPAATLDDSNGFRPVLTACGRGPMLINNVFCTVSDADHYCGGRFTQYACKTCFPHDGVE